MFSAITFKTMIKKVDMPAIKANIIPPNATILKIFSSIISPFFIYNTPQVK